MVIDILGNELKVGDTFGYAMPYGNKGSEIRLYKLLDITPKGRLKAEMLLRGNGRYVPGSVTSLHADQAPTKAIKLWLTFADDKE